MVRRGRGGRFVKSSAPRRVYRRARRAARQGVSMASRATGFIRRKSRFFTGGAPNTVLGRPVSRMVAPTLAVGAELALVSRPLSNGDSWVGRLKAGVGYFQQSKNPIDILATDNAGNNALSIASYQIEQNAGSALVMAGESVLLGWFGRLVGA